MQYRMQNERKRLRVKPFVGVTDVKTSGTAAGNYIGWSPTGHTSQPDSMSSKWFKLTERRFVSDDADDIGRGINDEQVAIETRHGRATTI